MAYAGTGYSPVEAAKGAQALTDIMAQPAVLADTKAKAEMDVLRVQGQKAYMEAEKKTKPLQDIISAADNAPHTGDMAYDNLKLSQELQQRKQAIAQEEQNLKLLLPEDRQKAEVTLAKMQKDVDTLEMKVLDNHNQYLGQEYALLDNVKDQPSLDAARAIARNTAAKVADRAIKDGKMSPQNREAFIQDQINSMLPEKYDEAGKTLINSHKDGLMTVQDQIKMKMLANQEKAFELRQKHFDEMERIRTLQEDRMSAKASRDNYAKLVGDIDKSINTTANNLRNAKTNLTRLETSMNKDDADVKAQIQNLQDEIQGYNIQLSSLDREKKSYMEMYPEYSTAKDKSKNKSNEDPLGLLGE